MNRTIEDSKQDVVFFYTTKGEKELEVISNGARMQADFIGMEISLEKCELMSNNTIKDERRVIKVTDGSYKSLMESRAQRKTRSALKSDNRLEK